MPRYKYKKVLVGSLPSSELAAKISLRKLYWPTRLELLLYVSVAIFCLLIFNLNALIGFYSSKILGDPTLGKQELGNHIQSLANYIDKHTGFRLAGLIVWFILGLLVYFFVWFITNIVINVRNDFIATEYIHPPGYNAKGYWRNVLSVKSTFVLSLMAIGLYLATIILWGPRLSNAFYTSLSGPGFLAHLPKLLGSIVAASVLVYVLIILAKICQHSWLLIQKGL